MTIVVSLLAVAVGLLTLLVFGLLRTHADILRALDRAGVRLDDEATGPVGPVPVAAPAAVGAASDIAGTVPGGGPVQVAVTGTAHTTLLAFLSSGCRTCQAFWEAFAGPDLELPGIDTRLVIVGQDPVHDSESALARLAPPGVRTLCSTAAWQSYEVPGSPYFVLVDGPSGRVVGAGSATSWDQVRGLLEQAVGDAGLESERGPGDERDRGSRRSTRARPDADQALQSAGIGPGHPSLYPGRAVGDGEIES